MLPQCVTFSLHLINRLLYSVATPMCNGLARMSKVRNHGMQWVMLRLNSNLSNNNSKETGVEKLLISEEINNNNILVKFKANSKVGEDNKDGADNNKVNNKAGVVNNSKVDGEVNNNKGGVASSKEDGAGNSNNNNKEAGEVNSKVPITGDNKDGDNLYDLHCVDLESSFYIIER